ncbi:class I SAM-dependent methyltransferase [Roseateles sp.]|uniref:class I SAM-dependent methyltransferase n=1 Tax=Roseateles sp. TaxID=1971397 RepID=UPI003264215A
MNWTTPDGQHQQAPWRSAVGHPPPQRVQLAGDDMPADAAYRLLDAGIALLWLGDYQNARHLLQALGRRLDKRRRRAPERMAPAEAFAAQREEQAHRTRVLGGLLLPFDADHAVPLPRAPDVRSAGAQVHGPQSGHYVQSLRELLGVVGAHEWRKKGVVIAALGARIHPHHGVFSPVRGEYVPLVAQAPLPAVAAEQGAFDIGTGTGVLAAVLARRGLAVTATDISPAAVANAAENARRLGLRQKIQVLQADLFPPGRAGLVVCNPPWVPAPAGAPLEVAVYDPDSRMLRGFLDGLAAHLVPGGEGWLILSDLAEHLGLRSRTELLGWIAQAGLQVLGRLDTRPTHPQALDPSDPLHAARAAELTSLWRLAAM